MMSCSIRVLQQRVSKYYTIKKFGVWADLHPPKNKQYGSNYIAKADNSIIEMVATGGAQESSSGQTNTPKMYHKTMGHRW